MPGKKGIALSMEEFKNLIGYCKKGESTEEDPAEKDPSEKDSGKEKPTKKKSLVKQEESESKKE